MCIPSTKLLEIQIIIFVKKSYIYIIKEKNGRMYTCIYDNNILKKAMSWVLLSFVYTFGFLLCTSFKQDFSNLSYLASYRSPLVAIYIYNHTQFYHHFKVDQSIFIQSRSGYIHSK